MLFTDDGFIAADIDAANKHLAAGTTAATSGQPTIIFVIVVLGIGYQYNAIA
jgi:hypothetical protein